MPSIDVPRLRLETGQKLAPVRVHYRTWGRRLDADGTARPTILVEHALTGDSRLAATVDDPRPGWLEGLVGAGKTLDTSQFFIVAVDCLGGCSGTTGPADTAPDGQAWGSRFPQLTIRDMVSAEAAVADALGIARWDVILGPSMGGFRALEWAVTRPGRVGALILVATSAYTSADQAAWIHPQITAITTDPHWHDGDYTRFGVAPTAGLGVARQIAHATYRCATELGQRFGRTPQGGEDPLRGGRFAVQSYLDHQAKKLVGRFDAGAYVAINRAILTFDIGRGDGVCESGSWRDQAAALAMPVLALGLDSDRLYPAAHLRELAALAPQGRFTLVHSDHGHDGFLIDIDRIARPISRFLAALAAFNTRLEGAGTPLAASAQTGAQR